MLNLIIMVLKAIASFMGFAQDKQQQDAGNANARADEAEKAVEEITTAQEARDKARDTTRGVPRTDELPDDGFRRD